MTKETFASNLTNNVKVTVTPSNRHGNIAAEEVVPVSTVVRNHIHVRPLQLYYVTISSSYTWHEQVHLVLRRIVSDTVGNDKLVTKSPRVLLAPILMVLLSRNAPVKHLSEFRHSGFHLGKSHRMLKRLHQLPVKLTAGKMASNLL